MVGRRTSDHNARAGVDLPAGVWFGEEVREMTVFAEQYDFAVSLLLLPDQRRYDVLEAESEGDVFDRFTAF